MVQVVVLDACVLFSASLRDILLRVAEAELYLLRLTDEILEETRRNLVLKRKSTKSRSQGLVIGMVFSVIGMIIGILIAGIGVVGAFIGGTVVFINISYGMMFILFGLMIFFIAAIRKSKFPLSNARKFKRGLGRFLCIFGIIFGIAVFSVGLKYSGSASDSFAAGIGGGIVSVIASIVIWLATRVWAKGQRSLISREQTRS